MCFFSLLISFVIATAEAEFIMNSTHNYLSGIHSNPSLVKANTELLYTVTVDVVICGVGRESYIEALCQVKVTVVYLAEVIMSISGISRQNKED